MFSLKMSLETFFFRCSIVLGLFAAVFTILYFTPLPDKHYLNCNRPCTELDWPMICRIKFTIEPGYSMSNKYCQHCLENRTHCSNDNCIVTNGNKNKLFLVNKQYPGPTIQVCHNDILVIDVTNKLPDGQSVSIHWRGQKLFDTPFMDGVPMVTQCPITSYTTFQYKLRASTAGTHLWEAYSNNNKIKGIFGALIVRRPEKIDPLKKYYNFDDKEHTILISEIENNKIPGLQNSSKSLLINGQGNAKLKNLPLKEFLVQPGKKYRFRIIYATGTCPVNLSIDKHKLKIISLDSEPIIPREVTQLLFNRGERVDFILKTNQLHGEFYLRVTASDCDNNVDESLAILRYSSNEVNQVKANLSDLKQVLQTYSSAQSDHNNYFDLTKLLSMEKMPEVLRVANVQKTIYLPFGIELNEEEELLGQISNLSFTFPSKILMDADFDETDKDKLKICNDNSTPKYCLETARLCECVHLEKVRLRDTVELILINQDSINKYASFHLHGYSFWVTGMRHFNSTPTMEEVVKLNENGQLFTRNLINPPKKDTITLSRFSTVALRFQANNPGLWILREESSTTTSWSNGADMILQVGDKNDIPELPADFPKCGNFVGPEFFII